MESLFEKLFYSARWILAPLFLGLSLALLALALKFFQEVWHVLPHVFELSESDLIENFVSRLDLDEKDSERLGWLGKMDAGSLKNKVAASIVAISSIHLLRIFMNISTIENDKLLWYVIVHLTFVLSALVMCWIDLLTRKAHQHDGH